MEKWKFYKLALIARFKVCVDQFIRVSFGAYFGVKLIARAARFRRKTPSGSGSEKHHPMLELAV